MEDFENIGYDVERNRLIGADAFGDFKGHPVKKILLSMSRAMALKDELLSLDAAYKKQFGERAKGDPAPYPVILAAMSPGFEFDSSSGLPQEYSEIAQVISVVPGITNLNRGMPSTREAREHFVAQLFRVLRVAHFDAHIVLNRGKGTSFDPEYITAKGEFTDLYFIANVSELPEQERRARRAGDLSNALGFLWQTIRQIPIGVNSLFELALSTYLNRPVLSADLRSQIRKTVDALALGSVGGEASLLMKLAEAVQREEPGHAGA